MTGCAKAMPGRSATICVPTLTIKARWPGSWKTTMNLEPPRRFAPGMHEAAAVITFLSQGLRFFHQGQFEGDARNAYRHIWSERHWKRPITPSVSFMMTS